MNSKCKTQRGNPRTMVVNDSQRGAHGAPLRPMAAAMALALSGTIDAANIAVDGTNCTLADALRSANTDSAVGGCGAGKGADTLNLTAAAYTLAEVDNAEQGPNGLPMVASELTVEGDPDGDGQGAVIERASGEATPEFRLLTVAETGTLTVHRVTLRNGHSDLGGGLYNAGATTLIDSTVSGNQGGGIANRRGEVVLRNSVVSENTGANGGGLNNREGNMTLVDSVVSDNRAEYGAGLRNASGSLTLTHSTVSDNEARYAGGGLYNFNGEANLADSTVSGNSAGIYGGGVYNPEGQVNLVGSTLSGNKAKSGGGLANLSTLNVTRSTVSDNSAETGGGLWNDQRGVMKIRASTVTGNQAAASGGGLANGRSYRPYESEKAGRVTIAASTFSNNQAGENGGAIQNWDGRLTLVDSTISGNQAAIEGGGVYNSGYFWQMASMSIRNSTLAANRAETDGGGLFMRWGGSITLGNVLIADSQGPGKDCSIAEGEYLKRSFLGVNLIQDGSCGVADAGGLSGDPKLGPLQDNGGPTATHALLAGSPAIDAADDALCRKRDQRRVARPQAARCDIGAFEHAEADASGVETLVNAVDRSGGGGEFGGARATVRRP